MTLSHERDCSALLRSAGCSLLQIVSIEYMDAAAATLEIKNKIRTLLL